MRWLTLATLAAAAAALAILWGDVPDRWVVHWGLSGRPDGWAVKSVPAAAMPLLVGLFAWILMEGVALWLRWRRARNAVVMSPEMAAVQVTVLRAAALAVALLMAGLSLALPLLRPRSPAPLAAAALACVAGVIAATRFWASGQVRRLRASGVAVPDGYRGLTYNNPSDTRLWVPKLSGLGWTINFAHRLAWPVLIALVGGSVALAILISRIAR